MVDARAKLRFYASATVAALFLLGSGGHAYAQAGRLIGTVTRTDGSPLPATTVEVRCEDSTRTVGTDANGKYEFSGLPAGECQITAGADGFVSAARRIVLASDHTSDVPLTLTRRTSVTFATSIAFGDSRTP